MAAANQRAGKEHLDQPNGPSDIDDKQIFTPRLKQKMTQLERRAEDAMRMEEQIERLTKALDKYERVVARADPDLLAKSIPDPVTTYSDDLPNKVLSLAWTGMSLTEIIVEMGVSKEDALNWKREHPEWASALARAPDLATMKYHRQARKAIEAKNERFPLRNIYKLIEMIEAGLGDAYLGDASELVVLDASVVS